MDGRFNYNFGGLGPGGQWRQNVLGGAAALNRF